MPPLWRPLSCTASVSCCGRKLQDCGCDRVCVRKALSFSPYLVFSLCHFFVFFYSTENGFGSTRFRDECFLHLHTPQKNNINWNKGLPIFFHSIIYLTILCITLAITLLSIFDVKSIRRWVHTIRQYAYTFSGFEVTWNIRRKSRAEIWLSIILRLRSSGRWRIYK